MNSCGTVGQSNTKIVEMVYSLLEMLRMSSPDEMSAKLLLMSHSPQICHEMRQYGCLPLLIQLIHQQSDDADESNGASEDERIARQRTTGAQRELRERASKTLRNIVHNSAKSRREVRVLKLVEDLRSFVNYLRVNGSKAAANGASSAAANGDDFTDHPNSSVAYLLKVSFDEEHRRVITLLGGVYAIAEVIQYDYEYHRNARNNGCVTLRRYSLMALINLTFGDSQTKSLLAAMKAFMRALVHNLESPAEELRQVAASLLRNLSWKADYITKQILREVGTVALLAQAALEATKESTLKSILSALWNLTAHCGPNKADFCRVDGALPFLISTLTYTSATNSITIVENGGGILRNISSFIVGHEEYREVLRKHKTIAKLLEQLKSPSITVVSNSCVTLWNLSAHCPKDQTTLWEANAVPMLRNLTASRHKMIAMGASATLKNLFNSSVAPKYIQMNGNSCLNGNSCSIPSLQARKLKALKDDINCDLSETYDPIDSPKASPSHEPYARSKSSATLKSNVYLPGRMYTSFSGHINPHQVSRSSSHDSIGSTHSEPVAKFKDIEHNLRSIYPFSTQVMPQMYSTLSSNDSRVSDKDLDIGSDFDAYCGESNSQMNISSASAKSSSFTDPELDADPEPTDYSARYKERPIDDFVAPRANKPEATGCEDSVKVYKTEGTPLNFSLASSLSDLRDCAGLTCIDEEKRHPKAAADRKAVESKEKEVLVSKGRYSPTGSEGMITPAAAADQRSAKVMFKKPIPPPKPKFATTLSPKKPTVDESDGDDKRAMKTSKSVESFDDNYMKASVSTNSIVSIDVSNENICEETPLMYSRSSSLGSLSDCDVKSDVCQSSVVSEFSRRASEVVSPSDIPDSPLDSPQRPLSPKLANSSAQTQERTVAKNFTTNSVHKPSATRDTDTVFEDRPINYATEGTPAIFSLSTSLSSLTEDINGIHIDDNNDSKALKESDESMHLSDILEVNDIKTEIIYTSSEDEAEEQLLAACISSGMKTIEKKSNDKTISGNSLQRIASNEVVLNSSHSSKAVPIAQPRITSRNKSLPTFLVRSAPDDRQSYLEKDSVRVYGTEGTPIELSKTSSISELSISTNGKFGDMSTNRIHEISDDSDDEEVLQKCIESGMTANRKHSHLSHNTNHKSSKSTKRSPQTPKTTPNASPNSGAVAINKKTESKDINADQTKRFFVEDTPVELSHCQSPLSELSFDSDDHFEDQKILNEVITRGMNQKKSPKGSSKSRSRDKRADNMTKSCHSDDTNDDTITYTVCHKSERFANRETNRKLSDSLMTSSAMTDSSCLSDLDHMKPPSLMDNSMFSSSESFSYRQIAPKPAVNAVHKKSDEKSEILLDNVKPPSIMDEISMSQSCASITSDIPELVFDGDVKNSDKIGELAKMCANRINSMTYLADTSDADAIERNGHRNRVKPNHLNSKTSSTQLEYDISDTEVSEDLPIDKEALNSVSQNDIILDFTTSSSTLLSLESPTICADVMTDFDDKTRLARREKELMLSKRRFSPIGSEGMITPVGADEHSSVVSDDSDPDSRATYNVNSPRRARIVRPVARKSPKDDFQAMTQTSVPLSASAVRNKYTAKPTRTSALRASRSRSVDTHLTEDMAFSSHKSADRHLYSSHRNKYIDYMTENNPNFAFNESHNASKPPKPHKSDDKDMASTSKTRDKSLISNVRSKLSASLSSHALGSSNASLSSSSSNGLTPSCASFSGRLHVQSRIASLWKRSKSSSVDKSDKKKLDLSRSVSARRSFGKSSKTDPNSGLQRSSTYEKLPQSADEASHADHTSRDHKKQMNDKFNNNYIVKHESSSHQKRQQNDKTNGNSVYLSSKSAKTWNKLKTNKNSVLNNNLISETFVGRHPVPQNTTTTTTSGTAAKTSANSRRTCLVTAV